NRAAAAGINIAVSSGNDARDTHTGSLIGSTPVVLPNNSMSGFSGSFLAPFTVASAQGTGYAYNNYVFDTTAKFTGGDDAAIEALADITLRDNNGWDMGTTLTSSYEIVDCGLGSKAELLKTADATVEVPEKYDKKTDDALNVEDTLLNGKIALIQQSATGGITLADQSTNVKAAGAVGAILVNSADSESALSAVQITTNMSVPTFGKIKSSVYTALQTALKAGTVKVSFTSKRTVGSPVERSYADNGPSSFTSWGVTGSLKLKPDIMTPGGQILAAGASSDTALSIKSGTSMASPNMEGCFILVQQYVDDNLSTFGVTKGTQAYTDLVNQLVASTATAYQPMTSSTDTTRQNLYFSPRRQGAGMANIGAAISDLVVLHNNKTVDTMTGEAPRTKIELGEVTENEFDITFYVNNYDDSKAKVFNVSAALQTDATTSTNKNYGTQIANVNTYGSDIDPIEDAVLTVKSVGGTETSSTTNVNKYASSSGTTKITVPANARNLAVVVHVKLNEKTMAAYDKTFFNGMFLEGFVFLDGVTMGQVDLSIPFLGFRGDWSKAPIFDMATAYDDVSKLSTSDPEYPMYYITTLSSQNTVPESDKTDESGKAAADEAPKTAEVVLGANQYTGTAWPGYSPGNKINQVRSYLSTQRTAGDFSGDFSAISPNGDGYNDFVYANLALLQNAKALMVVITDADKNVVKTIGPEFEYFETNLGNSMTGLGDIAQIAATYGQTFKRNMKWDGTNNSGEKVADGQYYFNVIAIKEYEFLNKNLTPNSTWDKENHVMTGMGEEYLTQVKNVLLAEDTKKDTVTMPVKVDTKAPVVVVNTASMEATVTDETAVQAVMFLYDGKQVGDVVKCNAKTATVAIPEIANFDASKLEVQAVDYAFNKSAKADQKEVNQALTVTASDASVYVGVEVTLTATGDPELAEGTTYKWYKGSEADGSDAELIEDATEATLTADTSAAGTTYYFCSVEITAEGVGTIPVNSDAVSVKVSTKPATRPSTPADKTETPDPAETTDPTDPTDTTPAEDKVTTVTAPDGTVTETTEKVDGTVAVVETKPDGTVTATVEQPDGTKSEAVTTPEGEKTIVVTDAEGEELAKIELPAEKPVAETTFVDVVEAAPWAEEAVNNVAALGLVKGIGDDKYDPVTPMTRGALATVLHRLSQGKTNYSATFKDVAQGKYYTEGVAWAAKANVVTGISEDVFAPENIITREQLAVMLARYAKLIGMDTAAKADSLKSFADGAKTGTWAVDGMAWAVENGILQGKGANTLDPSAEVSRAEVAVMLDRFIDLIQK
ncbi:MAG: S-layer homology domain-containing protein, partial [Muribaculaceae bacterium]|nr:S-layer homology domain-containing protein [Muribaculaceae bacterium]